MKKKIIKIVGGYIACMVCCYLIGQNIVLPLRTHENSIEDQTQNETELKSANDSADTDSDFASENHLSAMTFEGNQEVEDNPWGFTIGEINVDEVGNCLLMMPGTKMKCTIDNLSSDSLEFSWMIHPWVSEQSDGMVVKISLMDLSGSGIKVEESFDIYSEDGLTSLDMDVSQLLHCEVLLSIECMNGKNNDSVADWLVIQYLGSKG